MSEWKSLDNGLKDLAAVLSQVAKGLQVIVDQERKKIENIKETIDAAKSTEE